MAAYSRKRALSELLLATALWGYGFVATILALREFNAVLLTIGRFLIPFLLLYAVTVLRPPRAFRWSQALRQAFVPGLLMGWMVGVQTIGMLFTNATKSGFITSLYVIFVPAMEACYFRQPIHLRTWVLIGLGLTGMYFISEAGQLNTGDLLTLVTAVLAALHIIWFDRHSQHISKPILFNGAQCFWAALCSLPLLAFQRPRGSLPVHLDSWFGFAFLIVFSTLISFTIQIRAQRVISSTVSSLLFLLEAPFAAIFAGLFLRERLTNVQWAGAAIILTAVVGATLEAQLPKRQQA